MATFKKKDIKEVNVDELVDIGGAMIGGDESYNTTSQIKTSKGLDTDNWVSKVAQRRRWPYLAGFMGTAYSHGDRGVMPDYMPDSMTGAGSISDDYFDSEKDLDEGLKKIEKMVEDVITNKFNSKNGLVDKPVNDINNNQIPDLDELSSNYKKPNIASNIETLVNSILTEKITGEERAIILNYLISAIGVDEVDNKYREILKNKL